jgi:starvation-inducible DNA-binding protein
MQNGSSVVASLKSIFADTYALYLKTQGYHWNVVGMHFAPLHLLFESQYENLAKAVDELAEQIRVLGEFAPCTFADLSSLTNIPPAKDKLSPFAMIEDLLDGHDTLSKRIENVMSQASHANDEGSVAVLSERLTEHQKTAWMLRASLES